MSITSDVMLSTVFATALSHFPRLKTIREVEASDTTTFALLVTNPKLASLAIGRAAQPQVARR